MSMTSPSWLPPINEVVIPNQSLYPCMLELRVSSLERAIKFFTEILFFKIISHQEFDDPNNQANNQSSESPRSSRYSLTDVAPSTNSEFRFRLRFNYNHPAKPSINHSETGLRHVELQIPGALSRAKVNGYKTNTEDGQPIVYGPDELPLLFNEMGGNTTPNNASSNNLTQLAVSPVHRRGSIGAASPSSGGAVINPVITLSFWTRDIESTFAYYSKSLGLSLVESDARRADTILFAFNDPQQPMLEFVQLPSPHELALSKDLQLNIAAVDQQAIEAVSQRSGSSVNEKSVTLTDADQRPIHVIDRSLLTSSNQVIVDWKWRISHGSGEHSSQHGTPRGSVRKMEYAVLDDNQFEAGGDNDKPDEEHRLDRKRSL